MYKKITILIVVASFSFLSSCPKQDNIQNVIIGQPSLVDSRPSDLKRAVSISTFPPDNQLVFTGSGSTPYSVSNHVVKILPIVKYNDGSTDSDVIWNIGKLNSSGVEVEQDGMYGLLTVSEDLSKEITKFVLTIISKKNLDIKKDLTFCRKAGFKPYICKN